MFNLKKRAYFTNLGELRMLLADMPDDTEVCTCGVLGSYLHFEKEKELISFDTEDLSDAYDELVDNDDDTFYEKTLREEAEAHDSRLEWLDDDRRYMLCGDKLMRTFLADDGSWDYELYDISLSVVDSGQLGENRNLTRAEVINTVLSWNHLDKATKQYLAPPIGEELYEHFDEEDFVF